MRIKSNFRALSFIFIQTFQNMKSRPELREFVIETGTLFNSNIVTVLGINSEDAKRNFRNTYGSKASILKITQNDKKTS
jgi:hypothetical protein